MLSFWRASLIGRLILLAAIVFAVSIPSFFFLFSTSVSRISNEVVDTRLLEFAGQLRGYWASEKANTPNGNEETDLVISSSGLGGPDIEWVWQITVDGKKVRQSELLVLTDAIIPASISRAKTDFILSTHTTPLGVMRVAERIIEEPAPGTAGDTRKVHYLVGLSETRYNTYVQDHKDRLGDLSLIGVIIMSVVILALLALVIVLVQRQLAGIKHALGLYEKGDTEGIEGRFPTEIQSVVNLMNDLLRHNQKLIARTRKYVSKITHDINHPLAILKNGLKTDIDIDLFNRQIARMSGLVDRYASLARAIGPEGETRKKTDVSASLKDTADGFSILYRRTPLSISCVVEEGLNFVIPQHDLEAAISNLVSNAHKYADSEIVISAKVVNQNLIIDVEDDGPGIAFEQMETALKWGQRLDEAPPGTGFGLSIVSDILDLYGGTIQLSTSSLGGLAVHVEFPSPENRLTGE